MSALDRCMPLSFVLTVVVNRWLTHTALCCVSPGPFAFNYWYETGYRKTYATFMWMKKLSQQVASFSHPVVIDLTTAVAFTLSSFGKAYTDNQTKISKPTSAGFLQNKRKSPPIFVCFFNSSMKIHPWHGRKYNSKYIMIMSKLKLW